MHVSLCVSVCECNALRVRRAQQPWTGDVGSKELLAVSARNKTWSSVRPVLLARLHSLLLILNSSSSYFQGTERPACPHLAQGSISNSNS